MNAVGGKFECGDGSTCIAPSHKNEILQGTIARVCGWEEDGVDDGSACEDNDSEEADGDADNDDDAAGSN
jgi:hypothetical protein